MSDGSTREMTLAEVVAALPPNHRARVEYTEVTRTAVAGVQLAVEVKRLTRALREQRAAIAAATQPTNEHDEAVVDKLFEKARGEGDGTV